MKLSLSVLSLLLCASLTMAQAPKAFKYQHILITNDDGIEDVNRLLALARSVKAVAARVSIVVSTSDRSGTSNYTTFGKYQSSLEVTCTYYEAASHIKIYEMPGNPADCVILGLNGLFPNDKPDLVLSGINSGANIGPGWFKSGTIGAVRMAAYLGVRGVALSGFDDEDENSYSIIPTWITEFISSEIINDMGRNDYLTISFPEIPIDKIAGVKLANRRTSFDQPESIVFYKIHGESPHEPENKTIWAMKYSENDQTTFPKLDEDYLDEGFIVVTPMSINENNPRLMDTWQKTIDRIPSFPPDK